MEKSQLPTLYASADAVSTKAQCLYLRLMKAGMGLQLAGVAVALLPFSDEYRRIATSIAAFCFGTGLILTIILRTKRYEKTWYGGRAAAESVKTGAWRYALCSEPYLSTLSPDAADKLLLDNFKAVLAQKKDLGGAVDTELPAGQQITGRMREIRALSTAERLAIYLTARVNEQRKWYLEKAKLHQRATDRLYVLWIVAQVFTLVMALLRVGYPNFINLTGLCSAISTVFLTWLQIRKHQELAQSYFIATHELALVCDTAVHVKTDSEVSSFVADAEAAISREHTLWVARRDSPS